MKEFPQVDGKLFEPKATVWILRPSYAGPNADYWQRVQSKCKPLSIEKVLSNEQIQVALADMERMNSENAQPKRLPNRPRKSPATEETKTSEKLEVTPVSIFF